MRKREKLAVYKWCAELWKWCAETGLEKHEWPEWKKHPRSKLFDIAYGSMGCFYCAVFAKEDNNCKNCPFKTMKGGWPVGGCMNKNSVYREWGESARGSDKRKKAGRKVYLFVKKALRKGEEMRTYQNVEECLDIVPTPKMGRALKKIIDDYNQGTTYYKDFLVDLIEEATKEIKRHERRN